MGLEGSRGKTAGLVTLAAAGAVVVSGTILGSEPGGGLPLGTTLEDFFLLGTQPDPTGLELAPFIGVNDECILCHGSFELAIPPLPLDAEPVRTWSGSMMGQATRDPIFWAAVTVANQDADFGGGLCLRCHTPAGWLSGRSTPTDGSALVHSSVDYEGVSCHFCHRMVDLTFTAGNPVEDIDILDDLDLQGLTPVQPGTGQYVVDPNLPVERRRGPFDLGAFIFHGWLQSPFHQESALCGTCHDASNPLYTKQPNGSYALNTLDTAHPTFDQLEMFPIERTYSEWANSQFASGGVVIGDGRFGGNLPDNTPLESCQDCHMPDQVSPGCRVTGFANRPDMAAHFFNGGNTWVLKAIDDLYTDGDPVDNPPLTYNDPVFTDEVTGLTTDIINESIARATYMLESASDLQLTQNGIYVDTRVINMCGHKLPTGYNEGRRIWINVQFLDDGQQLIYEHGAYDNSTAVLTEPDTKVYKAQFGLDAAMAAKSGLPQGESFHFALNNEILLDNRIPPLGFTNAAFAAVQAEPVAYSYADGQNWDDTSYLIPPDAAEAVVTVYHQLTSKEYIEFLRDENVTDSRGHIAYNQWVAHGKSPPVVMDSAIIALAAIELGDLNNDGTVGITDLFMMFGSWGRCPVPCPPLCLGDLNGDCLVNIVDMFIMFGNWD